MEKSQLNEILKLAVMYHNDRNFHDAELLYRSILERDPLHADAWHLSGLIAYQIGEYHDALDDIQRAIELHPHALFYSNLAMVYDKMGEEEISAENFMKALEMDPIFEKASLAHYNLGIFYADRGMLSEALRHYDRAVALDGNFFDARWNRSLLLLLLGRFEEGWKEYESRFKKEKPIDSRIFGKPRWDGLLLNGKRILVVSEQGFGDTLHFIRYLFFLKEKGVYVILECKKELRRLLEGFEGIDKIVEKPERGIPSVEFDYYIHLMSLPRLFLTDLENIPHDIPYLRADLGLVEKFSNYFDTNHFKIGIVWAGNPEQINDIRRSMTFEKLKVLKERGGIQLFSLQKGEASRQLQDPEIMDLSGIIRNFADTAALVEHLDLVISVDTSVAHLAGAMGKPTWVLLSAVADWRWLLDREDSPWYPTMRLFRQKKLGDWGSLLGEVRRELEKALKRD